jgi:Domain of unknown function (DUF4160)
MHAILNDLEARLREAGTLSEAIEALQFLLDRGIDVESDKFLVRKGAVDSFDGLRVTVNPNEHPPPHFHVRYDREEAIYRIDNGSLLHGRLPPVRDRAVRWWFKRGGQAAVVAEWNSLRPTDCPLGPLDANGTPTTSRR